MKRTAQIVLVGLAVVVAASCSDKQVDKTSMTSPGRPRLTMAALPSNASTVCVAAVKERDQLYASSHVGQAIQTRIDALDALVEDTCY